MKIICYGDSNTYGYDPSSLFGESYPPGTCWTDILKNTTGWDVQNEGMNGREVPDSYISFPGNVDLIIIMLGTNDLLQFWRPVDVAAKMKEFLLSLKIDRKKLILIAPPTMCFGEWVLDQELIDDSITLAEQYACIAADLGIQFLDSGKWNIPLAYDGVHFTREGHRIFAEKLLLYLMK